MTPNTDSRELEQILDNLLIDYGFPVEYMKRPIQTQSYEEAKQAILAYTANKQHEQAKKSFDLGWNARGAELVKAQREVLEWVEQEVDKIEQANPDSTGRYNTCTELRQILKNKKESL